MDRLRHSPVGIFWLSPSWDCKRSLERLTGLIIHFQDGWVVNIQRQPRFLIMWTSSKRSFNVLKIWQLSSLRGGDLREIKAETVMSFTSWTQKLSVMTYTALCWWGSSHGTEEGCRKETATQQASTGTLNWTAIYCIWSIKRSCQDRETWELTYSRSNNQIPQLSTNVKLGQHQWPHLRPTKAFLCSRLYALLLFNF